MKKIFSYALTIFMAFTMCANANAKSTKEIAFQMYSVRDLIGDPGKYAKNHEDVLKKLAAMGYTAIEAACYGDGKLYGITPEQFKSDIEAAGMKVLSSHVGHNLNDEELSSGNIDGALNWWKQCIDAHKAAGMKYLVNPGVNFPRNLKEAKVICNYLNKIGEMANASGLKFGYHNHSYEFNKVESQVWYDYMLQNTDASKVFFQMDVYWAVRGQVSPVEYFNKYPGRFRLLLLMLLFTLLSKQYFIVHITNKALQVLCKALNKFLVCNITIFLLSLKDGTLLGNIVNILLIDHE